VSDNRVLVFAIEVFKVSTRFMKSRLPVKYELGVGFGDVLEKMELM
jgi:hypothetical protein